MRRIAQLLIRLLPPVGILAASSYAFMLLSAENEASKKGQVSPQKIRTRVQELDVTDYHVRVRTHGTVIAHNHVTLSADVDGVVVAVHSTVEAGSYFKKGDVLIEIDDRDYQSALEIARADQKVALATQLEASNTVARIEQLKTQNAASESEADQALAALKRIEGELDRIATQITQAERDLTRTRITAPFDGRVEEKLVGVGQRVSVGTALASVFAVDYAEVRLPLSGKQLAFLSLPERAGDAPVNVELRDAIDDSNLSRWNAQIVRTEGTLDTDSLELFAIARIGDPFGLKSQSQSLRIGQPVVAMIDGQHLENVVLIPRGAVRQLDQIYLVNNERLLHSTTIKPVWSDAEFIVVDKDAISRGDLLATTMLVYAPDGSEVEVIPDPSTEADSTSELVSMNADTP